MNMDVYPDPYEIEINGLHVGVDDHLGHLWVAHEGAITWDELQAVKNAIWGASTAAIEVYPPQDKVINNVPLRHLWRLGPDDFWPDLLGRSEPRQTLERRFHRVWDRFEAS